MLNKSWRKTLAIALVGVSLGVASVSAEEIIWIPGLAEESQTLELTLEEAIAMTLGRNPQLDSSDASRQASRRKIEQARSGYGPTIGISHSEQRNYQEGQISYTGKDGTYANNFSNRASLDWVIYDGGLTSSNVSAAKENYKSSTYDVVRTEQSLKEQTSQTYYHALQADKTLAYAEESLARMEEHLKNVTMQYEVGLIPKADVLRSSVEVANAKQTMIRANNTRELAYASLNNLIWVEMDTVVHLEDELLYAADSRTLQESIAYAKIHRPEIHQSLAAVEASKDSVRAARSGYYPKVSMSAGYGRSDDSSQRAWENEGWNVGGTVSLTLFDSFYTRGRVGETMANQEKAEAELKNNIQAIELEVRQSWLNMQEAKERIDTSTVAIAQAEEDYKIAQARYMAGVGTNLDVLDSQNALTNAQTNYIGALYDYNSSRASLDRAMGLDAFRPVEAEERERKPLPAEILQNEIDDLKENPDKIKVFPLVGDQEADSAQQ